MPPIWGTETWDSSSEATHGVVGDKLKEGRGRFARRAASQIARVVLDPVAGARRLHHLQVEAGALFQPLGFQQFALVDKLGEAILSVRP